MPFAEVLLQTAVEMTRLGLEYARTKKMAFTVDTDPGDNGGSSRKKTTLSVLTKLSRTGLPALCVLFSVLYFFLGIVVSLAGGSGLEKTSLGNRILLRF